MKLGSVNIGNIYPGERPDNQQSKKAEEAKAAANKQSSDRLEISDEAMKLAPIQQKIASGFYDNPEVLREVARRMNQQIFEEKPREDQG